MEVEAFGHCSSFTSGDKILGNGKALHLTLLISAFPVIDFSLSLQYLLYLKITFTCDII